MQPPTTRRALLLAAAAAGVSRSSVADVSVADRVAQDMALRAAELRQDVAYPPALLGDWRCRRELSRVDGEVSEATTVWKALGGAGDLRRPERFAVRFIATPDTRRRACVLDRGFEYSQRSGLPPAAVTWSGDAPDRLSARMTTREAIDIEVLTRDVRPFSPDPPYGFGFTEKLRIRLQRDGEPTEITATLSRQLAPASDGAIEGSETLATFRSIYVSGSRVAAPSSTLTSRLRLTREPR